VRTHIIDQLRPEPPDIDPAWESETLRAILLQRNRDVALPKGRSGRHRVVQAICIAAALVAIIGGVVVARDRLPSSDLRPAGPASEEIVQTIDPSKATVLELGGTLDVVADLPQTFGGGQVLYSSFVEDTLLVGDVTPPSRPENSTADVPELAQESPIMYDLDSKTFTLLDDAPRSEPTQVVDASGTEDTIVWAELIGTSIDHSTFTFYAYNRATKNVTTLGEFNDPEGQVVYGNDLTIADDTAYFSTRAYPRKSGQGALYAVPVDGTAPPRILAAGGQQVRIIDDILTYHVANPDDTDQYPTFFTYDLKTGETTPAPVSAHVDASGFCGAEFTKALESWCVGRAARDEDSEPALLTIKERSGRITKFEPFPSDSLNAPIPHDIMTIGPWTAITMTSDGGQDRKFLVDLDTTEVLVFPDHTSFGPLSSNKDKVLVSSFAANGPGPQRIVRIPRVN
jgi:hypothetical protein